MYSRNHAKHTECIWLVLAWLRQQRLYTKLETCKFDWVVVKFLGHCNTLQRMQMDPATVEAVLCNQKDVQHKGVVWIYLN